jgi:hypothetical protein
MQPWIVPKNAWKNEPVFILGGGPSLKGFDAGRLRGRGRVIGVNNAGLDMMPDCDVLYWADRRWLQWNRHRLAEHTGRYKITRNMTDIRDVKVLRFLRPTNRLHFDQSSVAGWCGGSNAIDLARMFGARVVFLLGFDMRPGNWHNLHLQPPLPDLHREKFIPTLEQLAPQWANIGMKIFNCNERSALRCFPFVSIEEVLKMDNLAAIEREKYLQVWEHDEYRKFSPGMMEFARAMMVCPIRPGQSLIDFGSGPCRATKSFKDHGIDVLAIDHVPNACEFDDVPFLEACLWDLPASLSARDWGFCTDVMEHIPTNRVQDVIRSIAENVTLGCYFRIATRPDVMGMKLIGKYAMTVSSGEWWRRQIEKYFELVDVVEMTGRDIMLLARH